MTNKKVILVKYGEIALRKGNRAIYERRVISDLRYALGDLSSSGAIHVIREQGRILLEDTCGDIDTDKVLTFVKNIFGINAFCSGMVIDKCDLQILCQQAYAFFKDFLNNATSFKVETKRGDKNYPITSNEISAEVGGYILERTPYIKVDIHNPQIILYIEIRNRIYFYTESYKGEGGLPYGTSGKGLLLLSGGIDSPVAGYMMAKRGVEITAIYFHSPPHTSERAADKVKDLAKRLSTYMGQINLYIVPFTKTQLFLYKNVQTEKLTILLKRAMLLISSMFAKDNKAHCLITGDSVGQVASQTIHSLEAVNSAAKLPILRPLAAMDKQEITDIAKRIETYDISIRPYEDCCTLFVAKHPESKPKASVIEGIESRLLDRLNPLLVEAFNNSELFSFPQLT